jgi:radical SAM-linked protein
MSADAPDGAPAIASVPASPPIRDKVRLRFHKGGDLRLLSHHDLMRTFERLLRRAALPLRRSQGFHPKPRLVFALSLPLGVVGCEEVAELELDELLPLEEIEERLKKQCPPGLRLLSLRRIDPRATAQVRALCYRVAVPAARAPEARRRAAEALTAKECWVERTRPPARRLDIRPFLRELRFIDPFSREPEASAASDAALASGSRLNEVLLEMDLWLTPSGTARPEEVLGVLGLSDLVEAGAVLERARLELIDEIPPP